MFSVLLISKGFTSPVDALSTCMNAWDRVTDPVKGVAPLNLFADGRAGAYAIGVYVEINLDLDVSQTGNKLSVSAAGLRALDAYLQSTNIMTSDGTPYAASQVWPPFGRSGEFGSLIAIVVAPTAVTPEPAELYQISLSEGYTRPIVAAVATGDSWHMVLARAVAQTYAGLGDEYEFDGTEYAQVPDTYWVPQTNIMYVTANQRQQLAENKDPVSVIGQQNFPESWGVQATPPSPAVWLNSSKTANPPPQQPVNYGVQLVEGAGGYRQGAFRCDFDCLMRRKPNSATMPIQDHLGLCHACEQAVRMMITGTPDVKAWTNRPRLNSQKLAYDVAHWTPAVVDITSTPFHMPLTAASPSSTLTWKFNADVNPTDGFKITDLKLQGRPGDPYQAADDVCEWIAFQELWVQLDGGQQQPLNLADAFTNTADPPKLEQASNSDAANPYLAGLKLTLTCPDPSGWRIQAAFSLTVKDKRNDFDPGGAAEACKFYPQLALRYLPPAKGSGKLPKVTGLGGSIVLRTNNVIPAGLKLDPSLQNMANGILSSSLFVDTNNSDFDSSYTLAKADTTTFGIRFLGGLVPAASFGLWSGEWQSGRKLAGVIDAKVMLWLLSGATARVAHLDAGYPVLPHWSWLFDYCWPDFSGSKPKMFTAVYRAGQKTDGGNQDIVRKSDPIIWPSAASQTGTPQSAQMTVRKLPRQGAYDSLHVNAAMMQDSKGRDLVAAPFCADLCLHLHWRWGTDALTGATPSRLYAYRGWGDGFGDSGAGTTPGYPLIPPNQHLDVTVDHSTMDRCQITYAVSADQPAMEKWQVLLEQGIGFAFTYNGLAIPQVGLLAGGVGARTFGPPPLTDFEEWVTNLQGLRKSNPASFDVEVRLLFMDIYGCIRWYDTSTDKVTASTQQIPGGDADKIIITKLESL